MTASPTVFTRILCGVDESPTSLEAVRQAHWMVAPGGTVHLLAVVDESPAVHAGWAATTVVDEIRVAARDALSRALEHTEAATARLLDGKPVPRLLHEAQLQHATLLALGGHDRSRAAGILLGDTATTLLHEAPCSVLLARPAAYGNGLPASIVVGVDGSPHSRRALAAAKELADRYRLPLRAVAALGGKPLSREGLREIPNLEYNELKPTEALVAASDRADLVVIGSRGLHGFEALGSVSERVAHEARCPVLVVRTDDTR